MTRRRGWGIVVAILTACNYNASQLTPSEQQAVVTWLECEECTAAQRAAVQAIGPRAIPTLNAAIRNGPSSRQIANMTSKYNTVFTTVRANLPPARPGALALTQSAFVDRAISNYVATYQRRAIAALRDLGGLAVLPTLQSLGAAPPARMRADVVEALRLAAAAVDTAKFRGTMQPANPGFGDTVIVRPPPFELFNGNEVAAFEGSAAPATETMLYATRDSMAFIVVGRQGRHVLAIRNVGVTTLSQYLPFTISTNVDRNDRGMAACLTVACQINNAPRFTSAPANTKRIYLTQWHTQLNRDTMDLVRFEPTSAMTVKAELDWVLTSANFNLNWSDCFTLAPRGNTTGATTARPETTRVTIPAGQCWVLKVTLSSGLTPLTFATLALSP